MITQQLKTAWLAELRDPENQQVYSTLFGDQPKHCSWNMIEAHSAVKTSKCMCAMGCLIKAHALSSTIETYQHTHIQCAIAPDLRFDIIQKNDLYLKPFREIADFIEANVEAV